MGNRWGNSGNSVRLYFLVLQNYCRGWLQPWNWKTLTPWKKSYDQLDSIFKSRDITLPTKVHLVKAMVFPVVMYGCESWTVKKAACWELMLLNCGVGDDSWASLGLQGKQSIRSEEDQPLDNFGRNYAKAEAPVLWQPHVKSWLIGKDSDAGRDWGQEEKGMTEDEMAG